ncbi:MAG: hypothetical protein A2161_18570 [Candidatus Schekmanbacteria bacterium RBG_13_48_7]|uniref:DUF7948 domain-containing protein n=1 Tax=Candidatus Schekmanbacteria bacterium RBG_13_48_7 TaxID=1817878 RepID=A0A1F7RVH8_9BACT|nr:MAG: hypothetical protein A2161_18570 [Candidatus Schekmanbacteria bacterium RBG_13_48_7]
MKPVSIIIFFIISFPMFANADIFSSSNEKNEVIRNLSSNSAYFIKNLGQIDNESVQYYMKSPGKDVYLTDTGVVMDFYNIINDRNKEMNGWQTVSLRHHQSDMTQTESLPLSQLNENSKCLLVRKEGVVIKMNFIGADLLCAEGENKLITKLHYFLGNNPNNWRSNLLTYKDIIYKNIYTGIDLRFCANPEKLKYQFEILPSGNPSDIKIRFTGIDEISIDNNGNMIIRTPKGNFIDEKLYVYQMINGKKVKISAQLHLIDNHTCVFKIERYDAERPLIIDPGIVFSTYLGISVGEQTLIIVDSTGSVYITGDTFSSIFPTTLGAYDTSFNGAEDAFISKLSADGSTLLYSTFLGGSDDDFGHAIALDGSSNIYVAGITVSPDFAVTPGAFDTSYNGGASWGTDVFVSKLSADGSRLIYSTYIGGSKDEPDFDFGFDVGVGLAVNGFGNAYVTGFTESTDFPTTSGAYNTQYKGLYDVFVSKINADGSNLLFSTFIGEAIGTDIVLDGSGNVFVTGLTWTTEFPTTLDACDTSYNGNADVFVSKLNADGASLIYSTFIGGNDVDQGNSIDIDSAGNAYITGYLRSTNFPTTPSCFDISYTGAIDAFVCKLSADGSTLIYSTYLGGSGRDEGKSIAVDATGNAYITGTTNGSIDFPVTPDAFDKSPHGVFISKLSDDGSMLLYSTFLGGEGRDTSNKIEVFDSNYIYVSGLTQSTTFPTTPGAYKTYYSTYSGFITKFDLSSSSLPFFDISHFLILVSIFSLMIAICIHLRKN